MWSNWGARKLPEINIGGTQFYLDLRLNEFREVNDFSNRIDLDLLKDTDNGYQLLFDPKIKNIFSGTQAEFEKREMELVVVSLPSLEKMDPLGFSMLIGEWKKENPMLSAMIESIPKVLQEEAKPDLLPQQEKEKSKGKSV